MTNYNLGDNKKPLLPPYYNQKITSAKKSSMYDKNSGSKFPNLNKKKSSLYENMGKGYPNPIITTINK